MKKILAEIHEQPSHIREIFMWLSVIITVSVIGFFWFRSTQRQVAALLNPSAEAPAAETRSFAKEGRQESPFATISTSWRDLQATISNILNFDSSADLIIENQFATPSQTIPPRSLPVTDKKIK